MNEFRRSRIRTDEAIRAKIITLSALEAQQIMRDKGYTAIALCTRGRCGFIASTKSEEQWEMKLVEEKGRQHGSDYGHTVVYDDINDPLNLVEL